MAARKVSLRHEVNGVTLASSDFLLLHEGRLHLPTISGYFRLALDSLRLDNVVHPTDASGLTLSVFEHGASLAVTGTPLRSKRERRATPCMHACKLRSLRFCVHLCTCTWGCRHLQASMLIYDHVLCLVEHGHTA